jgi:DNA repair protein RecN (Recombination protein N)
MLLSLSIKNYALIESLQIDFSKGFNAITGETGAGKSILLGALGLIAGKRADKSVVRSGEKKCVVEARFVGSKGNLDTLISLHDLDEDDICTVRREVNANGKSRAFINDTPVTLEVLRSFGDALIDIHSQHENLLLSDAYFQLRMIDLFSGSGDLLEDYKKDYNAYQKDLETLRELEERDAKLKADQDYIQFQFYELEEAELKGEELAGLEEEQRLLESSEDLSQVLNSISEEMSDSDSNVLSSLQKMLQELSPFSDLNDSLREIYKRLNEAEVEISDLSQEIQLAGSSLSFDDERKQIVSDRLDVLNNLLVKHRVNTSAELIEIRDSLSNQLLSISSLGSELEVLRSSTVKQLQALMKLGKRLSDKRKASFDNMEVEILAILSQIGMASSQIQITNEVMSAPGKNGLDKVSILFSANKGQGPQVITKIASGGEIARFMLALKSITAKVSALPTIVFDEIDTGISGDIAGKVGEVMSAMSDHLQLLTISHLPQIAAKGDSHFKVSKEETATSTISKIERLNESDRLLEIATMLSGSSISEEAKANAKALLG